MNIKELIKNKDKYKKEFNVWKNINYTLKKKPVSDKLILMEISIIFMFSFFTSFLINSYAFKFNFENFLFVGCFLVLPSIFLFLITKYFLKKIKYKINMKKNEHCFKILEIKDTVLIPSSEKKIIEYIKKETNKVGFNNYLKFKKIMENNNYNELNFEKFVASIINNSNKEELLKISEDELLLLLEDFSLEEQKNITKIIKEKLIDKDLSFDIKENLKDIKRVSFNKIIKEI